MKILQIFLTVIWWAVVIYALLIISIGFISWIFGIEPQHLLPGMNPYSE